MRFKWNLNVQFENFKKTVIILLRKFIMPLESEIQKAQLYIDLLSKFAELRIPYSFAISKILWELTIFLPTGSYRENWKVYPRASDAAEVVRKDTRETRDLKKRLRFEHPLPINIIYQKIQISGGVLSRMEVAKLISEFPPVLITRDEDAEITRRKLRSTGDPYERYKNIPLSFDIKGACIVRL
jgi:hypothetical protein